MNRRRTERVTWDWPLPQDVCSALFGEREAPTPGRLLEEIENPALLLQRYVPFPSAGQGSSTKWEWNSDQKSSVWNSLLKRAGSLYRELNSEFWTAFTNRQQELAASSLLAGGTLSAFPMRVAWRLSIGLGVPHPLETGIALHHLYGVPYLPGSAVKGVTRAWRLHTIAREFGIPRLTATEVKKWEKKNHDRGTHLLTPIDALDTLLSSPVSARSVDALSKEERNRIKQRYNLLAEATQGENARDFFRSCQPPIECSVTIPAIEEVVREYIFDYSQIFGSQRAIGEIMFFDAYPVKLILDGQAILELDVMTPHHSNYYAKAGEPTDRENPVPVKFPVVAKDTEFLITLGGVSNALLKRAAGWVKQALQDSGIGAKTRAGYGELTASDMVIHESPDVGVKSVQDPELESAIERWKSKDMGQLDTLIKRITSLGDQSRQRELAQLLQQKLARANRWRDKYSDKKWYQAIDGLRHAQDDSGDISDNALQSKEE